MPLVCKKYCKIYFLKNLGIKEFGSLGRYLLFTDAPADKKEGIRAKVKEYMGRAELIKQKVKEDKEGTHVGT